MASSMIDKLDVRVPSGVPFTREFGQLYSELRQSKQDPFRHSRLYTATGDLRPYGYDAILHVHALHGEGNHKVELIDTGAKSYSRIRHDIESIFDVDSGDLETMRIDLAADLEGVPVHAFVDNVRGKWKRSSAEFGEYRTIGKRGLETFYLGKRPNLYRFYNKISELKDQYARLKRGSDAPIPSFEDLYRYPESGLILTRAERQIGGGGIPETLAKVSMLTGLADFDPFDRLEVIVGAATAPDPLNYRASTLLQGLGYRQLILDQGMQNARRLLNQLSNGNASRLTKKLGAFVPMPEVIVTEKQLYERYRESVKRQLAV